MHGAGIPVDRQPRGWQDSGRGDQPGLYRGAKAEAGEAGRIRGGMLQADPMELARLGCITAAEAEGYRRKGRGKLYGWGVKDFRKYPVKDRPLHINDIGLNRPPQSWQYVRVPYAGIKID